MPLNESAVSSLRAEFPALQQTAGGRPLIFFDGPGGTQVHGSVIEAMRRYYIEANSNSHGAFLYSRRTSETVDEARRALADFLNAPRPEEIVFGPNMTTLTFNLSRAIGRTLAPGDEIIVTRLDHDANIAPWMTLEERGAAIRFLDFDPADCTLNMASLEAMINERTRLVAVGYASNAVGTINDVRRIADLEVRPAGDAPPDKFETGTGNFEAMAGATATVDYLASVGQRFGGELAAQFPEFEGRRRDLKAAMTAIHAYEQALCHRLVDGLQEISGLHIYGITDPARFDQRVPTVSFTLEGLTPNEVARRLDAANIFVWDGNFYALAVTDWLGLEEHGGLVRVGLAHYSTAEEVDRLVGVLGDIPR